MKVIWSDTAKLHWFKTLDQIAADFGVSAVETFIKKTTDATKQLSAMPNSGPIEPLLFDSCSQYRSIVFAKHSKFIYSVFDDCVYINDFWDTRQESSLLKNRIQ